MRIPGGLGDITSDDYASTVGTVGTDNVFNSAALGAEQYGSTAYTLLPASSPVISPDVPNLTTMPGSFTDLTLAQQDANLATSGANVSSTGQLLNSGAVSPTAFSTLFSSLFGSKSTVTTPSAGAASSQSMMPLLLIGGIALLLISKRKS